MEVWFLHNADLPGGALPADVLVSASGNMQFPSGFDILEHVGTYHFRGPASSLASLEAFPDR